ncbi:DnaJ domain [Ostreococcus tauri]|uniref:DnaJ domain n=1 Tax=Ostreococcus tauri TaxID=70448 RepID=A0A090M7V6_OSTTA|nr:DnaJ domain [Ostreococcus tauri]CEF98777.1 DnaJ domain [Ostreococcus tauri]|eukprot:XP_022839460.1 DnaJ domain [Ostreococcus tauri]
MPVSLRPVAAPRGAKRIVIDADGTPRAVTNAVDVLGYVDRTLPRIIAHVAHVNGALGVTAGAREVFVQDARGRVRMLRPNASATLRRGEVLFLQWSKARGTRHGYVLERDDGVGEVQGAEVIEVVDSESDDGTAVKVGRGAASGGGGVGAVDATGDGGGGDARRRRRRRAATGGRRARAPAPEDGLPDDPVELQSARRALKGAHRQLVNALQSEVAMRQTLAQSQLDFQRTMRGRADYVLRQWHKDNLGMIAGKYQQSQFAASAARISYQEALRLFHAAVERAEAARRGGAAASPNGRGGRATTSENHHDAREERYELAKKALEAECRAWEVLLAKDPTEMSLKDLRVVATDVGVDTTVLVERGDFVAALEKKKKAGDVEFKERKRKREAEFDAAETRRKARREKEEEESAHREAVQQVSIWSAHADLRLFLHRCGISIEQHGRSTKSILAKAYRQAMLKFHPDRARQKSTRERALADEVTKWLTHAWQSVPP